MKKHNLLILISIFSIALISPFATIFIIPQPCGPLCQSLSKFVFHGSVFITLIVSLALLAIGIKQKKYLLFIFPLMTVLNPIAQPIYLEPLDDYMNYKLRDKAVENKIIGMSPEDVTKVMGKPDKIITTKEYIEWDYKPLKIYWLGSKLQIFFEDGVVSSIDPNDD